MKRIAVSQRLDPVPGRDERRDALDAQLGALLWSLGLLPMPLISGAADPAAYLHELSPDGFLLSGGNDIGEMPARDVLEMTALDRAEKHRLPVFGICRGMQMINHRQGGRLVSLDDHVAVRHPVQGPLVGEEREVNSFHNHGIPADGLGRDLESLATAADGSIEAVRHVALPWLAVMWHPEREQPFHPDDVECMRAHFGVPV